MNHDTLDLPRDVFEPVISQPMEIEELGRELPICFDDVSGSCEIKTCYGDIRKIIDTLMDYARLLEMVCDQWDLQGFYRASYELRAKQLRKISEKYQAGIRYDYAAALEKCQKKREKKQRDDDVGGDALELAYHKPQRAAAKEQAFKADNSPPDNESDVHDSPWDEL